MRAQMLWAATAVTAAGTLSLLGLAASGAAAASANPRLGAAAHRAAAASTAGKITIYSSPRIHLSAEAYTSDGITAGPDGALWFTNPGNNTIGRITTTGTVTDYHGAGIRNPWAITTGPDGKVWFTNWNNHSIGRITLKGRVTNFGGAVWYSPSITAGPDRALWYTNWPLEPPNKCTWSIGRMTTTGRSTCYTAAGVEYPQDIVAGPGRALWFTNGGNNGSGYAIGRVTTHGKITLYPVSVYVGDIAVGSDGALWFTEPSTNTIARITTTGTITSYASTSISWPTQIAAGPDGALWFINQGSNTIGRITTAGRVTSYAGSLGLTQGEATITVGPDGAMWFTNPVTNTIGRITTSVTPEIYRKTPTAGTPGTLVTIIGRNLARATQVAFNGTPAAIISDTATYLVTSVPRGATTGRIAVTTAAGTAQKDGWFIVKARRTRQSATDQAPRPR